MHQVRVEEYRVEGLLEPRLILPSNATVSQNPPWGPLSTMAQTGVATLVVDDGESF